MTVYASAWEPDGVTYLRCRNRRASECPSCSYEYSGDMWQLLYAGVVGGRKGVPEGVSSHPLAFVTLTAPGFGAVHGIRDAHGRCRPRRRAARCAHGRPTWCAKRHRAKDPALGEPLCLDCYDHEASVLFNWHAPDLWRRFTIALRRALAHELGLSAKAFSQRIRVSYAKVAELQRRGAVHFHAVVRLDDAQGLDCGSPEVGHETLANAMRAAASRVHLLVPGTGKRELRIAFGAQVDVRPIRAAHPSGAVSGHSVAAYLAKYATKASEDLGIGNRALSPVAARHLGLSAHVVRLVDTAYALGDGEIPELKRMRRFTHMLGFRGHFATKSRRYSTTMGALRRARAEHCRVRELRRRGVAVQGQAPAVGEWAFAGVGWQTSGDALLAASAAAQAREWRQDFRQVAA